MRFHLIDNPYRMAANLLASFFGGSTAMQSLKTDIALGERLIFTSYADQTMGPEDRIFEPGQFIVVAGVNDDGGLQCFLTDEDGVVTSYEGDTVFTEEVIRLRYTPLAKVKVMP